MAGPAMNPSCDLVLASHAHDHKGPDEGRDDGNGAGGFVFSGLDVENKWSLAVTGNDAAHDGEGGMLSGAAKPTRTQPGRDAGHLRAGLQFRSLRHIRAVGKIEEGVEHGMDRFEIYA